MHNAEIRSSKSKFNFNKKVSFLLIGVISIVTLLSVLIYDTYNEHRNTIIEQQKEHLLTISRTAARSLENYFNEKAENLQFLAESINLDNYMELIDNFYNAKQSNIYSIYLVDKNGDIVYQASEGKDEIPTDQFWDTLKIDLKEIDEKGNAVIGPAVNINSNKLTVAIAQAVFNQDDTLYAIVATIDLKEVYNLLIAPIRTGAKGYTTVKDSNQMILMHPIEEHIGMNSIEGRKGLYPDYNLDELEQVIENQLKGEEGSELYDSYWWEDNTPQKMKKINSYVPAYIGNHLWIISTTMDYQEINVPIARNLMSIIRFLFIIIIIFLITIVMLIKLQRNKKALDIESKYLQELAYTIEELQKKEQQLTHYQKLKTIGTLTSGIAHEFNNLLTPILGYSEMMLQDIDKSSDMYEDISEIYDASKKAKEIIEQILVYSRRDKSLSSFRLININDIIYESTKMINSILPSNITIINNSRGKEGYVYGNPTQLNQILINLYTNAYHAMNGNGGVIEVNVNKIQRVMVPCLQDERFDHDVYLEIEVIDTGCGMDQEVIESIFTPFFTTKSVGEGTGLGLSVVQGIVLNHKGEIIVESKKNFGSKFTIYLPYFQSANEKEVEKQTLDKKKSKLELLVVDDNSKVIKMLNKGLIALGYKVDHDMDPLNALNKFRENPKKYDLLIIDYTMPGINGVQLARLVKKLRQDIKIILITGLYNGELDQYLQGNIIDEYIIKPISNDDLNAKIQKIIQ